MLRRHRSHSALLAAGAAGSSNRGPSPHTALSVGPAPPTEPALHPPGGPQPQLLRCPLGERERHDPVPKSVSSESLTRSSATSASSTTTRHRSWAARAASSATAARRAGGSSTNIVPVANRRAGTASTPASNQRHALCRGPLGPLHGHDHLRTLRQSCSNGAENRQWLVTPLNSARGSVVGLGGDLRRRRLLLTIGRSSQGDNIPARALFKNDFECRTD